METLKIALSKGRILGESLPLLERAGLKLNDDPDKSRKLIIETNDMDISIVIIRATDVPTYVAYGAADIGIAGKDILMEYEGDGLYQPLDLNIARCKLMLAGKPGSLPPKSRLRVATKYVNSTREYFSRQGRQVEIIKLYGSVELAPLVGLSDLIVDLVDSGGTLKANGLEAKEKIADISSWLIVNKAAMKMKHASVTTFINTLRAIVEQKEI